MKTPVFSALFALCQLVPAAGAFGPDSTNIQAYPKASYYHDSFHGLTTSNGERYDKTDFTAAHKTLPFNTVVRVTNKINNKSVVVRINDRGPFVRSRVIDLSRVAAMHLGMMPYGVVPVQVTQLELLDRLPLNDSLLQDGDVWDPYGNKTELHEISYVLWSTVKWKHAFYMASDLELNDPEKEYVIKVSQEPAGKRFTLLVTGQKTTDSLQSFYQRGFVKATVLQTP